MAFQLARPGAKVELRHVVAKASISTKDPIAAIYQ